jgi:predicted transcriptional regulator
LTGTLIIDVRGLDAALDDFATMWSTESTEPVSRYSFESYDALHRALAPNRIEIVRAMMGAGPLSIREVARRVGRDFKGVHTDVTSMVRNGLLYKADDGQIVFPFDRIRFDYEVGGDQQSAA